MYGFFVPCRLLGNDSSTKISEFTSSSRFSHREELSSDGCCNTSTKLVQENMNDSQSRPKSYHDKRRNTNEFEEGDHVFLRVTSGTEVCRVLKSRKLTPRFVGPY